MYFHPYLGSRGPRAKCVCGNAEVVNLGLGSELERAVQKVVRHVLLGEERRWLQASLALASAKSREASASASPYSLSGIGDPRRADQCAVAEVAPPLSLRLVYFSFLITRSLYFSCIQTTHGYCLQVHFMPRVFF